MSKLGADIVSVVILVLLCSAGAASSLVAQGERFSKGKRKIEPQCDPCGGICGDLDRVCVVARKKHAFCVDCTGLLKPITSSPRSFAECCKYSRWLRKCTSVRTSLGVCMRDEDLFIRASDPTPATFRNENGRACSKMLDFLDNGLACRVRIGDTGVSKCINSDGTEQQPSCGPSFAQVGANIDGRHSEEAFGSAVAMSADGSRVAVGAPGDNEMGSSYGKVQVFDLRGSQGWVQVGQTLFGKSVNHNYGVAIAMSADGSRLAIGSPNGSFLVRRGHVTIFEMQEDERWVRLGTHIKGVRDDVFKAFLSFGSSIAMSADGSRVVIGDPNAGWGANVSRAGAVQVFEMQETGQWVRLGKTIVGEYVEDESGWSVAMSAEGSRVAIGAKKNKVDGEERGHARVFELSGSQEWVQVGQDIDGVSERDKFGWSVAMSADGSRVTVGAKSNDVNGDNNSGHVRVFEMHGSEGWVQLGQDIDGEMPYNFFGWSVAMSADGNRVIVGADNNTSNTGKSVRIFELQASERWTQVGNHVYGECDGEVSGSSVAMSADGSRVAVGDSFNRIYDPFPVVSVVGRVRVFEQAQQCR